MSECNNVFKSFSNSISFKVYKLDSWFISSFGRVLSNLFSEILKAFKPSIKNSPNIHRDLFLKLIEIKEHNLEIRENFK